MRLDKIGASQTLNASWTDPRNGDKVTVGTVPPEGERQFAPPEKWEDAILLLESKL
ncbi:MAG TPA: putative collagen-binding domain-containing protein [Verrucomicrobiae bacterium]|nr:putative collagen-binding domain-containing protein [Verrucomicrobiae bacterium]